MTPAYGIFNLLSLEPCWSWVNNITESKIKGNQEQLYHRRTDKRFRARGGRACFDSTGIWLAWEDRWYLVHLIHKCIVLSEQFPSQAHPRLHWHLDSTILGSLSPWSLLTENVHILCKGWASAHDLFCLSRVSWWIKQVEQRLAQSRLLSFAEDGCAVNSVSALRKRGKNTCHLLIYRHTARVARAHNTLKCSEGKSFMKATFILPGMAGESETRPVSRTHEEWDIYPRGTGLWLLSKSAFPRRSGNAHSWEAGLQWPRHLRMHEEMWSGEELESNFFFMWSSIRDRNIGEFRTYEGQSVIACSAPRAGKDLYPEYSLVLSKHIGQ